ncbi:MAG: YggT family protein [Candidatus Omnitrophica bacterium]|nr:YggT family protein [Candidatus Omnitrophota bacterium]
MGNLFSTAAYVVNTGLTIYTWMVILRVLVSWVSPDPFNPIVVFLGRTTEPFLALFRRVIPPIGMIDLSPVVALLVLQAAQHFLVRTLLDLSLRLR